MRNQSSCVMAGIAGGSCTGKTWLARRLQEELGLGAILLGLDSFYKDLSHIAHSERALQNFDDPGAVDWAAFDEVLLALSKGRKARVPKYDFVNHVRLGGASEIGPAQIVLVDGLWVLQRPETRSFFTLKLFLRCQETVRLERRKHRDTMERGRSPEDAERQFRETVAPMHEKFVAGQEVWADRVLEHPWDEGAAGEIAEQLRKLAAANGMKKESTA